jgi:uncharacterized oligopeptide transporter (OPT) family protein
MPDSRCLLCDAIAIAALEGAEPAIAMTIMTCAAAAAIADLGRDVLDELKPGFCAAHRHRWVLALMRGGQAAKRLQSPVIR